MTPDVALAYGVTGPNLRASGVAADLRKDNPYLVYDRFDFDVPIGVEGDSYDRMMVRLFEMYQSINIVRQAIDTIPAGPIQAKVPRIIKVPAGEAYAESENPRGLMGFYVVSRGGRKPYRVSVRTGSFPTLQALASLLPGVLVPDIIAIMGSMDFVLGDIDR
jgi:NADH-quinone oxidoreductase subunit D